GDANGASLAQFERWYSQAGTPRVQVKTHYDPAARTYDVTLAQSCPSTPGQEDKLPFHIPVAVGLLDSRGRDLKLRLKGARPDAGADATTMVLELTKA